jgi:hypothetical protein
VAIIADTAVVRSWWTWNGCAISRAITAAEDDRADFERARDRAVRLAEDATPKAVVEALAPDLLAASPRRMKPRRAAALVMHLAHERGESPEAMLAALLAGSLLIALRDAERPQRARYGPKPVLDENGRSVTVAPARLAWPYRWVLSTTWRLTIVALMDRTRGTDALDHVDDNENGVALNDETAVPDPASDDATAAVVADLFNRATPAQRRWMEGALACFRDGGTAGELAALMPGYSLAHVRQLRRRLRLIGARRSL